MFFHGNLQYMCVHHVIPTSGGDMVRQEVAHNLMRLIAEGTEDETADMELRQDAVSTYIELLDKPHLPDILIKIICWVSTYITSQYNTVLQPNTSRAVSNVE